MIEDAHKHFTDTIAAAKVAEIAVANPSPADIRMRGVHAMLICSCVR